MADIFTQLLGVVVAAGIYVLIVISLPLIIFQAIDSFFPVVASGIRMGLESNPFGRIAAFIIKISFLINLIIVALLFYFFTWYYLLPSF